MSATIKAVSELYKEIYLPVSTLISLSTVFSTTASDPCNEGNAPVVSALIKAVSVTYKEITDKAESISSNVKLELVSQRRFLLLVDENSTAL